MLPDRSRKRKLPFVTLTRRISGTNALSAFCGVCLAALGGMGEGRGAEATDSPEPGGAATVLSSDFSGAAAAGRSSATPPGNLHFPSSFWGHTTDGLRSDTFLITKRREKSESRRT